METSAKLEVRMHVVELLLARLLAASAKGERIDLNACHKALIAHCALPGEQTDVGSQVEAELHATADRIFSTASSLLT